MLGHGGSSAGSYLADPTSPSPRTVLSLSCFKVSQCVNCCDWHFKSYSLKVKEKNEMFLLIIYWHKDKEREGEKKKA